MMIIFGASRKTLNETFFFGPQRSQKNARYFLLKPYLKQLGNKIQVQMFFFKKNYFEKQTLFKREFEIHRRNFTISKNHHS